MQVSRGYDAQTTGTNRNTYTNTNHNNDDDDNVFNSATDSIELDSAMTAWRLADENSDGVVDRREMANAAYQLLNSEDATEEEKAIGNMFATMVLGGKDGLGLDPNDSAISATDMRLVAGADGEQDSISAADLQSVMGDRVNPDGNEFSMADLQKIAQGQDNINPTNPSIPPAQAQPTNPYAPPTQQPAGTYPTYPPQQQQPPQQQLPGQQPGGNLQAMMGQILQTIIQMLMQLVQIMGGGAGQQRTAG